MCKSVKPIISKLYGHKHSPPKGMSPSYFFIIQIDDFVVLMQICIRKDKQWFEEDSSRLSIINALLRWKFRTIPVAPSPSRWNSLHSIRNFGNYKITWIIESVILWFLHELWKVSFECNGLKYRIDLECTYKRDCNFECNEEDKVWNGSRNVIYWVSKRKRRRYMSTWKICRNSYCVYISFPTERALARDRNMVVVLEVVDAE